MTHALLAGALAAFIACCLLVVTQRWHGRFTLDNAEGIQKFHTRPTPRIGGVGAFPYTHPPLPQKTDGYDSGVHR